MDFNTIETPAQLVELNESVKSPLELAREAMMMDGVDNNDKPQKEGLQGEMGWLVPNKGG